MRCLFIEKPNAGQWRHRVHMGIDYKMSRSDAQAIIDAPGDPFTAKMWLRAFVYRSDASNWRSSSPTRPPPRGATG